MMPTTPIGTRTRSMVMPFGRVQRSATAPTGSARAHLLPGPVGKCNDGRRGTRGRQMKLKDQVAVVTGAGRNIGEEIAKLFAAEGAKVAIVDVDKPRGERVVDAIRGSSGEAE